MSIWGCNFKRGNCDFAACNLINIYKSLGGGPENTTAAALFAFCILVAVYGHKITKLFCSQCELFSQILLSFLFFCIVQLSLFADKGCHWLAGLSARSAVSDCLGQNEAPSPAGWIPQRGLM